MSMEFRTRATLAKKGTKSIRTIIPIKITELLEINDGDTVLWEVDKDKTEWIVKIKKETDEKE